MRSASIRSSSGGAIFCATAVRMPPARRCTTRRWMQLLDRLAERMDWKQPFDHGSGTIRRGRGVALGIKACISPTTSVAIVNIYGDGSCCLYCSTVDMGQGSDTAMAQIVAEVLGLKAEDVLVIHPDTDVTPYDMATLGSAPCYHMGNAVKLGRRARPRTGAADRRVGAEDRASADSSAATARWSPLPARA